LATVGLLCMTHHIEHIVKAVTAVAAALAFTSTPLLAQEAPPPADPLAPAVADVVPPAPKPKVETPKVQTSVSKPKVEISAASVKRAKASASSSSTRPTVRRAGKTAPVAVTAAEAAAAPRPVEAAPPPVEPAPVAVAEPAPPPVAEQSALPGIDLASLDGVIANLTSESQLPVTGGAALGLLALAGTGMAVRRRKRRREREEFEARQQALDAIEAAPEPALDLNPAMEVREPASHARPEPAFNRAAAPAHDPVPDKQAPVTELPDGFDLSRFGPHVQAAYRGPTPDNPSLSLQYRLRRATALDQQERWAAEQEAARRRADAAGIPTKGNWESRPDADFLFRRAGRNAESVEQD
jgi:resuscitation-promoting factor RpfA